jgi:hypothetical protein
MSENALLENVYTMISIFRHYNIKPLFVFDGPPPKEKLPLLELRKEAKKNAEKEMISLKEEMKNEINKQVIQEMQEQMDQLKKKCVKIHSRDINKVKQLMDAYGMQYIDAPGEADELCAYLVINNHAYACMSEDMDMFVYGCPRVLRYFSILRKTTIMYEFKNMMQELQISANEFRQICVSSGTDYNTESIPLYKVLHQFKKYKIKNNDANIDFFQWIFTNTKYLQRSTIEELYNIENMFKNIVMDDVMSSLNFNYNTIMTEDLQTIMVNEDFIFPAVCFVPLNE